MKNHFLHITAFACLVSVISCSKQEPAAPEASTSPAENPATVSKNPENLAAETKSEKSTDLLTDHIGDFGSDAPVERDDLPSRGVLRFEVANNEDKRSFRQGEHWEQYDFPFQAKRWGRYRVKVSYILKSSGLGVQAKLGEQRVKKQLKNTSGLVRTAYIGEIQIEKPGDQLLSLYTPSGVGFASFFLKEISLIPTYEAPVESLTHSQDGSLELLAKHAVTWSEVMRYEPKSEKNCLGFWTDENDFAEWEFEVKKPGVYAVNVHQGCGSDGGSQVNILFEDKKLQFTVKGTGGYQNWETVDAGKIEISKPGRYRLLIKPETKAGPAVMDIQKIVLKPIS